VLRQVTLSPPAWAALQEGRLTSVVLPNAVLGESVRLVCGEATTLRRVTYAEGGIACLGLSRGLPDCRHVIGIDPGLASLGFACVAVDPANGRRSLLDLDVIETKPDRAAKKTQDDGRRYGILHRELDKRILHYGPSAIGFESYTVFDSRAEQDIRAAGDQLAACLSGIRTVAQLKVLGESRAGAAFLQGLADLRAATDGYHSARGRGAAAKVLAVVGIVYALAQRYELPVHVWTPSEAKRALTGRASSSKKDVEDHLLNVLGPSPRKLPKSKSNHAWDAAAFAELATQSLLTHLRQAPGIPVAL